MIKRNINFKSKDVIVRIYKDSVRPRLKFCVQTWCLYIRKDIKVLEIVLRLATKLMEGLNGMQHSECLIRTGLVS